MPKQDDKGVNIKSMTVFVIIIFFVISAVLVTVFYSVSWWQSSSLAAQYQPKFAGQLITAKLSEFKLKNNRFPAHQQELLNYLNVKNPVYISRAGAFRLKNYAYVYRLIDNNNTVILWAVPSPKETQVPSSDTEKYNEIEGFRAQGAAQSPSYFIVITPKATRKFQGVLTQKLTDIDSLPSEPSTNQLNSIGLFEKRQ